MLSLEQRSTLILICQKLWPLRKGIPIVIMLFFHLTLKNLTFVIFNLYTSLTYSCCRYKNKDGFNESMCKIGHYSPEKTIVTTESFFERSCKKTVGAIRDSDAVSRYDFFLQSL